MHDPYVRRRKNIFHHAGFRVGALVGLIFSVLHWGTLLTAHTDAFVYPFQFLAYFMGARNAAEAHYRQQQDSLNPTSGVQGAGVGAALVTSVVVWFFLTLFFVIADQADWVWVIFHPVAYFVSVVVDVLIAMGLGAWGGRTVERRHNDFVRD